jgi:hypothetical protein
MELQIARSYKNQLVGQIGENLVVAELGRRNIVATTFAGNVPDFDIVAYANSRTAPIQVKAWRAGQVHFDGNRYLEISFEGDHQIVSGLKTDLDVAMIFVFVRVGTTLGQDRFFIISQGELQKIIHRNYEAWLTKHNGVRPKNPQSTHVSVAMTVLEPFEDNWALIENLLSEK